MAEYAAEEMNALGLGAVTLEPVPVDAWRFVRGAVRLAGASFEAASLAGSPPTPPGGLSGELVFVGSGRRSALDRLDVHGCIALVDWRRSPVSIGDVGLELGRRGARGIIVVCLDGGARFQAPGALGTSVGSWHHASPPCLTVTRDDAYALVAACRDHRPTVTVELEVEIERDGRGHNVVGVLEGSSDGPVVVGAHHDGWFYGAFDNASGVAAMLALAKAVLAGGRPNHTIYFVSHTAEEFGRMDDDASWCYGAWHQVKRAHPEWGEGVPFFLDVEASGRPELPLLAEGPVELRRFAAGWCRAAARAGILPSGWRFAGPVTGTDQWPFQLAGVPGLSVYNWHTRFQRTEYHTNLDTISRLDFDHLEGLACLYTGILRQADQLAASGRLLDYEARARALERASWAGDRREDVAAAAARYARSGSRASFARLAQKGFAVDAGGEIGYLPEQAVRDREQLERGLDLLSADDGRGAARALLKVGTNALHPVVSRETMAISEQRRMTRQGSWAERSHQTPSPDLSQEIATLRREPGAQPQGPWLTESLRQHHAHQRDEAERRIDVLIDALSPTTHPAKHAP